MMFISNEIELLKLMLISYQNDSHTHFVQKTFTYLFSLFSAPLIQTIHPTSSILFYLDLIPTS